MENRIRIYRPEMGLDGTIEELIDWSYRYDRDYSDEALDEIAKLAKAYGFPAERASVPVLVKEDRQRKAKDDGTLPYEEMKLDRLIYGQVNFSGEFGEHSIEVTEDRGKVLLCITGTDDVGVFTAAWAFPVDEFMAGDADWLEKAAASVLFYNRIYEEEA